MTLDHAIAFFVFSLIAAITPGPSNVMITATGSLVGIMRGLPCVLGASIGMGSLLFYTALGLGQLVLGHALILRAMNWCGAAFLLWLALKIATAGHASESTAARPVSFIGAALFQWVNPKGWLVAMGAVGTYSQGTVDDPTFQAVAFALLFFAAALPSGLVWLVFGALLQQLLRDHRTARIFNIVMGVALGASVAMIIR
jgi:threonine/homoserine/homoserine lactone efflux protein